MFGEQGLGGSDPPPQKLLMCPQSSRVRVRVSQRGREERQREIEWGWRPTQEGAELRGRSKLQEPLPVVASGKVWHHQAGRTSSIESTFGQSKLILFFLSHCCLKPEEQRDDFQVRMDSTQSLEPLDVNSGGISRERLQLICLQPGSPLHSFASRWRWAGRRSPCGVGGRCTSNRVALL